MATSISLTDTSLWPTLGQTIADLARHETVNRETMGAGIVARSLDRMNGLESTGAAPVEQEVYGGIVAGGYLDTINTGCMGPRDAVVQNYDSQRGMLTLFMGRGALIDNIA